MSNKIKVCIGMLVTVILICLLFIYAPPTVLIPALAALAFTGVSAFLWFFFNDNRKIMTIILIASLLCLPTHQRVYAQPSKDVVSLVMGCFVVGLGTVVVVGLWYACKKLPPPPGTCPCGCGISGCPCNANNVASNWAPPAPPTSGPPVVTNPPAASKTLLSTSKPTMPQIQYVTSGVRTTSGNFVDVSGNPWTYLDSWSFTLQSSTNLPEWKSTFTFNGYDINTGGVFLQVVSNNIPIYNAFYTDANNTNNALPINFTSGLKPKEFFRAVCQ